jgi:hypothetical protein
VVSVLTASGLLIIPAFNLAIIAQHNPLRYASNIITLTLMPNFHVTKRSSITVTGLNGSLSADSPCLNISVMHQSCNKPNCTIPESCQIECNGDQTKSSPPPLSSCGNWSQTGLLVLTAQHDGLLPYDRYVIQFVLRNGEEQPAVTVKIGAMIDSPSVPYLFGNSSDYPELLKETETRFADPEQILTQDLQIRGAETGFEDVGILNVTEMNSTDEYRLGVRHASLPLFIMIPRLEVQHVRQARFWPNLPNLINVTFKTNCNINSFSKITIEGLTRTQTNTSVINITLSSSIYNSSRSYVSESSSLNTDSFNCAEMLVKSGHESEVGVFGREAEWEKNTGTMTLSVQTRMIDLTRVYELSFILIQPIDNQGFPRNINMSATIESGLEFDAPIYSMAMSQVSVCLNQIVSKLCENIISQWD